MDILNIGVDELCSGGLIPVRLFNDESSMFSIMAEEIIAEILEQNAKGKTAVIILPVGPVGQYRYFVDTVNSRKISLNNTCIINMDEYAYSSNRMVEPDHPLSFRGFMRREVYGKITPSLLPPEEWRVFPDLDDLEHVPKLIFSLGGVDACFGGIGINGHVAFNEPPEPGEEINDKAFLNRSVHAGAVARETLLVNSLFDFHGAYDMMPKFCVTVGMKEINEARKIRLYCLKPWHGVVVRKAAFAEKSSRFPVSLMQGHPDISISLPRAVAELK